MSHGSNSGRDPRTEVGLVGVGRVGQWFVAKLVEAGYDPVVFDVDEDAVEAAVSKGATKAGSPAVLTEQVELVLLSLPGREAVERVMEGADGVLETLDAGQVVVDTGTTPPDVDVHYQSVCHGREAGYVDCGITHEGPGEFDDRLGPSYSMFVGGTREDYERARPVVEALSHGHEFYEGIGNGHLVKAANRLRQTCRAAVASEVCEFLTNNGVDPERVVDQLEWDIPAPYTDPEYLTTRGFDRALRTDDGDTEERRFRVDHRGVRPRLRTSDWANDPAYALDIARSSDTHVPMLTAADQSLRLAENYGRALVDRELSFGDEE